MDAEQFRAAAHAAIDEIIDYHETVASRSVMAPVSPGYLAPLLPTSAPDTPELWTSIQRDLEAHIKPGLTRWQHPGFMAFFPSNTSYPSMLGELFSAAYHAPAFNWQCSPAITELETVMMDWVAKALALPDCFLSAGEGGGVIQGSASEAILVAAIAARDRFVRRRCDAEGLEEGSRERERRGGEIRAGLVLLASDQAHSIAQKAAMIAGTPFRTVETQRGDAFAMRGDALRRRIEDCRAEGLEPYFVCATLGTTSTCAVDDFASIADALRGFPEIWSHVDAAYAGSALVLPEYQRLYSTQMGEFDSFNFNLHKWLLTNFDASCLFVRRQGDLIDALSVTPSYLRNSFSDSGAVTDYRDWQVPLGRRFRALKVWFVLRSFGLGKLREFVRGHIELGEVFAGWIRGRPDLFEVFVEPRFALTTLAVRVPDGLDAEAQGLTDAAASKPNGVLDVDPAMEDLPNGSAHVPSAHVNGNGNDTSMGTERANRLTKEVYEAVNADGQFFLTNTVVKGAYVIRVVSANANTEEKWLRRCFDVLVGFAEQAQAKERRRRTSSGSRTG